MQERYLKAIDQGDVSYFYKSKTWQAKRNLILGRDNYECQKCKENGKFSKGDTVHHIKHLKDFPELGLKDDNLITLCFSCHEEEHPDRFNNYHNNIDKKDKFFVDERW